jgi:hypothetical protein
VEKDGGRVGEEPKRRNKGKRYEKRGRYFSILYWWIILHESAPHIHSPKTPGHHTRSIMPIASTTDENLRAVVEVVPVVAGAHPVVIGGGVVGLVVGVGRGVVELAGLGVLAGGLGVQGGGGLTVESLEHLPEGAG